VSSSPSPNGCLGCIVLVGRLLPLAGKGPRGNTEASSRRMGHRPQQIVNTLEVLRRGPGCHHSQGKPSWALTMPYIWCALRLVGGGDALWGMGTLVDGLPVGCEPRGMEKRYGFELTCKSAPNAPLARDAAETGRADVLASNALRKAITVPSGAAPSGMLTRRARAVRLEEATPTCAAGAGAPGDARVGAPRACNVCVSGSTCPDSGASPSSVARCGCGCGSVPEEFR
jgi:hypothetical protein